MQALWLCTLLLVGSSSGQIVHQVTGSIQPNTSIECSGIAHDTLLTFSFPCIAAFLLLSVCSLNISQISYCEVTAALLSLPNPRLPTAVEQVAVI